MLSFLARSTISCQSILVSGRGTLASPLQYLWGWWLMNFCMDGDGNQCPRLAALGLCEPEICQSSPIAAQTSSSELEQGPTHKGKTMVRLSPPTGRDPYRVFPCTKTGTCTLPNPAAWFSPYPEHVLSLPWLEETSRQKESRCGGGWQRRHNRHRGKVLTQPSHGANIPINHHYKTQEIRNTT